MFMDPIASIKH
jgi:polar amino acid transport system substrate-binding protein